MATEIRLNQSISEHPQVVAGGDFGAIIASTLTGAAGIAAIVDGDLIVRGAITGEDGGSNLTGNVTGNVSGTAATVTAAAQPAITSVGILTGLRVTLGDFADDAAAAVGGVPVNGLYHTAGAVKVRLA